MDVLSLADTNTFNDTFVNLATVDEKTAFLTTLALDNQSDLMKKYLQNEKLQMDADYPIEIFWLIVDPDSNKNMLEIFASNGNFAMVEYLLLLSQEQQVDLFDYESLLYYLVKNVPQLRPDVAVFARLLDLLTLNGELEFRGNHRSETPLHEAALWDNVDAVQYLLPLIDNRFPTRNGDTFVHYAIRGNAIRVCRTLQRTMDPDYLHELLSTRSNEGDCFELAELYNCPNILPNYEYEGAEIMLLPFDIYYKLIQENYLSFHSLSNLRCTCTFFFDTLERFKISKNLIHNLTLHTRTEGGFILDNFLRLTPAFIRTDREDLITFPRKKKRKKFRIFKKKKAPASRYPVTTETNDNLTSNRLLIKSIIIGNTMKIRYMAPYLMNFDAVIDVDFLVEKKWEEEYNIVMQQFFIHDRQIRLRMNIGSMFRRKTCCILLADITDEYCTVSSNFQNWLKEIDRYSTTPFFVVCYFVLVLKQL
eukprot:TRINITY_DN879_c1_g1_i5.p1 TRINITY_DN879_c1_g1~~TRINITY_DN879_c1_g1_i5.p1  ORF type:complete len:477 (+),score=79.19 TRINITY_DN879_c1_g1_i5:2-1432(+)